MNQYNSPYSGWRDSYIGGTAYNPIRETLGSTMYSGFKEALGVAKPFIYSWLKD
jgi:hypothetical protein